MPAPRTAILAAALVLLAALAAEPLIDPGVRALSRQAAGGEGRGGLQQIQPGHYVYLHTDDTPGVSSTSRNTGASRASTAMEMAVRRTYLELTTGLD